MPAAQPPNLGANNPQPDSDELSTSCQQPHPLHWLPNALVWLRLGLAAVFVRLLSVNPLAHRATLLWATAIFILAALTDLLDGRLARAWHCITRFGRIMDSFADKILILGAFVCLAGPQFSLTLQPNATQHAIEATTSLQVSGVLPWMVVLILSRELLITSLRGLVEGEGGDFSAIKIGKLKMVTQSIAIPLILLLLAFSPANPAHPLAPSPLIQQIIQFTVWAVVLITVLSSVPYISKAFVPTPPHAEH